MGLAPPIPHNPKAHRFDLSCRACRGIRRIVSGLAACLHAHTVGMSTLQIHKLKTLPCGLKLKTVSTACPEKDRRNQLLTPSSQFSANAAKSAISTFPSRLKSALLKGLCLPRIRTQSAPSIGLSPNSTPVSSKVSTSPSLTSPIALTISWVLNLSVRSG